MGKQAPDEKKPKFNPEQPYTEVGTVEDVKPVVKKPAFNPEQPYEEVTAKKKEESVLPSSSASAEPGKPSEKSTPESTLSRRNELLGKVVKNEFADWSSKRSQELQKLVKPDNSNYQEIVSQFDQEQKAKQQELTDVFGKFGDLYADAYKADVIKENKLDFQENKERNPLKSLGKSAWGTVRYDLPAAFHGSKAVAYSSIKKFNDEVFGNIPKVSKETGDKATSLFEQGLKAIGFSDEEIQKGYGEGDWREKAELRLVAGAVKKSIETSQAGAEYKKYLTNSLDKLEGGDAVDFLNYAMSAVGQSTAQIPLSVATVGASSLMQEVGSIYMDGVQKLAQEKGKTIEQIIKDGDDNVLAPILLGIPAAALDRIGAGKVVGSLGKDVVMDSFRNRALAVLKSAGVEAFTEAAQTGLEKIGVSKGADQTWGETLGQFKEKGTLKEIADAWLQGFFGGGGLSAAGQGGEALIRKFDNTQVKKETENLTPDNIGAINKAAENIEAAVNSPAAAGPTETAQQGNVTMTDQIPSTTNLEEDAVQISSSETVGELGGGDETTRTGEGEGVQPGEQGEGVTGTGVEEGNIVQPSEEVQVKEEAQSPKQQSLADLREQILNSPEDLKWDGKKVTILTEKGGQMLRDYEALKKNQVLTPDEVSVVKTGPIVSAHEGINIHSVTDPKIFKKSLETAVSNRSQDALQVEIKSEEQLQQIIDAGGKLFLSEDGNFGAAVTSDGYMGTLFKNPNAKQKGVAKTLQDLRVNEGGRWFDAFGTHLEDIYIKNGFRPIARMKFNEEYAPEGWKDTNLKNKPDLVFFAYDPQGKYQKGEGKYFGDWDEAVTFVHDFVQENEESIQNDASEQGTDQKLEPRGQDVSQEGSTTQEVSELTQPSTQQQRPESSTTTDSGGMGTVSSSESSTPPPATPSTQIEEGTSKGPRAQTAVGARVEQNESDATIRERVKKNDEYVIRSVKLTNQEAKKVLDEWNDNEHAESMIKDDTKPFKPGVRATLAANLYERYKASGEKEKAADIAIWAAHNLTKQGQETAIAGFIWKSVLQDEDIAVMAMERENKQVARKLIEPIQQEVQKSKTEIDAEIRRLVEEGIASQVEERVRKAKLISDQKRKSIASAFDALKVKDVKGTANDVVRVIGASVWNGAVETMKRAILTGADVVNAVQAGIDYVRNNYKGTDFNEEEFKNLVTPVVQQQADSVFKAPKVKAESIDESKVSTPKIKGKKKKDFIQSVVDAHNEGKLTDEKFEDLYAQQLGYKPYSGQERDQIRSIAKTIAEAEQFKQVTGREEWKKLTQELKDAEDSGDQKKITQIRQQFYAILDKHQDLYRKAQLANQQIQKFSRVPNKISDTLISIMQGNLLTPISLVTNVYSNVLLQNLRFMSTAVGSLLDKGISEVAKLANFSESYKNNTINLTALNKGYFQGGWNGFMEGLWQLKTGSLVDEKNLREVQSSFSPTRAIERWADKDKSSYQKANDYIEGTFGVPAEAMFRLLNLGDKPFKRAAEMAKAHELGTLKGLKGNDLIGFVAFPDADAQADIEKAGREATFQQETEASKGIQKGISWVLNLTESIPYVGEVAKVVLKSQIPFVKTPINIVIETLDYALPPLTMARSLHAFSKGNRRQGNILAGKAIVGGIMIYAAREMFNLGLLEPEDKLRDKESKKKEARSLRFDTVPPNTINMSALIRGMALQGFDREDNDVQVSFKKMGVFGMILDIHSRELYKDAREGVDPNAGNFAVDLFSTAPSIASSALDQSFLAGTNTFLTAIQDAGGYETEQWMINTSQALSSIVLPNTISTISKASDEYVRDTYDKDFGTRLKNTYLTKVFLGEEVPPKINLWGDKIVGVPEGKNKYVEYLFDVTKFKTVQTDGDFQYALYKAWKEDGYNNDWLPSLPKRSISVNGVNVPVRGEDYALLCEYVGKTRKNLIQSYLKSIERIDLTNANSKEIVLEELKSLYSDGSSLGREKFLMKKGWQILSKRELEKMK